MCFGLGNRILKENDLLKPKRLKSFPVYPEALRLTQIDLKRDSGVIGYQLISINGTLPCSWEG
jgi:hypothetical protein